MVGRRQQIEVGPMSGESNVISWLEDHGIEPTGERVKAVFQRAKTVDRVLTDEEIRTVVGSLAGTRVP
jgi:2-isopropylmalate synthase